MESLELSEPVLLGAGTVAGVLWGLVRAGAWYGSVRRRKYYRALQAIEAGVELTYREYVRAIKEARKDGKLTDAERKHARQLAREAALRFATTDGINLVRELGEDYLGYWIEKLVRRWKAA